MAKKVPTMGEFEIKVLRMVWQQQPCTERQITELVQQERQVARTTVLKSMQRLVAKGLLKREKGAGPIRYRAAMAEERVLPTLVRRFVDGILGGSSEPLVAYLADSKKLSPKDLEALRAVARKMADAEE